MSLFQSFPDFKLAYGGSDELRSLARVRKFSHVEFRSGGRLDDVVEAVRLGFPLEVEAAPGAGKSTRLPGALAHALGGLVVHVLPYPCLAADLYQYVSTVAKPSVPVSLIKKPGEPWPESGWVMISAACLVAKWLEVGSVVMPECVVVHDECHESGAATACVRSFCPVDPQVKCYIRASATHGLGPTRQADLLGRIDCQMYVPESFSDPWSVEEDGAPWAVSDLDGNIAIIEDDDKRSRDLMQAYNYNGVACYRLTAGMNVDEFQRIMAIMRRPGTAICAVIVDSSFRIGYTLPVSVIIDSGKVSRLTTDSRGRAVVSTRYIYKNEEVQTRHRGGRLLGLETTYWRPQAELQDAICDLEQCDAEAFALICRLLGYRPPKEVATAKMAEGRVPKDVASALSSLMPLATLPQLSLCEISDLAKPAVQYAVKQMAVHEGWTGPDDYGVSNRSDTSVKVGNRYSAHVESEAVSTQQDTYRSESPDLMRGAVDSLRSLLISTHSAPAVAAGSYYEAFGLVTTDQVCVELPEGASSVRVVLADDKSQVLHRAWSPYLRSVAINSLIRSVTFNTIEAKGIATALSRIRNESLAKERNSLQRWASGCAERLTHVMTLVDYDVVLLQRIAHDFCALQVYEGGYGEEESAIAELYRANCLALPDAVASGVPSVDVKKWITKATSSSGSSSRGSNRRMSLAEVPTVVKWFSGYPLGASSRGVALKRRSGDGT